MAFIRTNTTMSHAYKIGAAQNQQIITQAKLLTYIKLDTYMPQCSLYLNCTHVTNHLLNCSEIQTQHHITFLVSEKKP